MTDIMVILGIILCVVSLFVIYKRLNLILFGKSAIGVIIGYGDSVKGYKGVESYPYKVKYQYDNKEYIAYSLESASTSYGNIPQKNLRRTVTVYFKESRPEVVTIKEFNGALVVGIVFLILGIVPMLIQLLNII